MVQMTAPRKEVLAEGIELWLADCRDVLPTLGKVDAVVTDPPYGQSYKVNTFYKGGKRENAVVQRNGKMLVVSPNVYEPIEGDDEPFDPSPLISFAPEVIIFGAHKFADRLPPGGWFVWDKVPNGKVRDQGDGEAAWINRDLPLRIFRLLWDGLCVGEGARHEVTAGQKRYHPAQKPEALMHWVLGFVHGCSVLDPYMGAGATGVAAVKRGKNFVGIEEVEKYFDIACRRISEALKQPDMFIDRPAPAKQEVML